MTVYVQDKNSKSIIPTKRPGMVRHRRKPGCAQVAWREPFTIWLTGHPGGHKQPLNAGIDLGTVHVWVSVNSHMQEMFTWEFQLRSDMHGLLTDRRCRLCARRYGKTRYRPSRLLYSKRQDELAPSIRAKVGKTHKVSHPSGEGFRQGFIDGPRSSGNFDVRRPNRTVLSHWINCKKLRRPEGARTLRIERKSAIYAQTTIKPRVPNKSLGEL